MNRHRAGNARLPDTRFDFIIEGNQLAIPGEEKGQGMVRHFPNPEIRNIDHNHA